MVFAFAASVDDLIVGGRVTRNGMTDTVENGSRNYGGNAVPSAAFLPLLSSPSSASVLLSSPASKRIQSCSMPRRPPTSFSSELCPARPELGRSEARTQLDLPVRAARTLQRRRRSSTYRCRARATYHKEVVGLPLPPFLLPPSSLRLSVCRSFLRGNWMTQKASQVSAAATRHDVAEADFLFPSERASSTGIRCAISQSRAECEVGRTGANPARPALRKRELIREALIGRSPFPIFAPAMQ